MSGWATTGLTRLLHLRYPIVQGPMGGGLSTPALVAAVSNAGGLGSLGAYISSQPGSPRPSPAFDA